MRSYELLFIVAPTETEEAVDAIVEQLRTVATERGATFAKVDKMGRRRLAYPIRKQNTTFNDGTYIVITIEGMGTEIAELERRLRVMDVIIRHLTVRIDEDLKRAEKFKTKRQNRTRPSGSGGGRRSRSMAESEAFTDAPDEEETADEEVS